MSRSIGVILLGVFLITYGLLGVSNFQFDYSPFVLGALAIGAGVFLLLGR